MSARTRCRLPWRCSTEDAADARRPHRDDVPARAGALSPGRDPADRPRDIRLRQIAGAVVNAWDRPQIVQGEVDTTGVGSGVFWDRRERERNVQTGASVSAALGERVPAFKPIIFDADGQEIRRDRPPRSIEDLPFATTLENRDDFRAERARSAAVAVMRGVAGTAALAGAGSQLGVTMAEALVADGDIRRISAWVPPSSPGGVALNPRLTISGSIGTPERITFDDDALVLVTSTGRYPFEAVSTRSLRDDCAHRGRRSDAVHHHRLRAVNRAGYAAVTYAPVLMGTAEGEMLYAADVQFKAIFLGLPLRRELLAQHAIGSASRAATPGPRRRLRAAVDYQLGNRALGLRTAELGRSITGCGSCRRRVCGRTDQEEHGDGRLHRQAHGELGRHRGTRRVVPRRRDAGTRHRRRVLGARPADSNRPDDPPAARAPRAHAGIRADCRAPGGRRATSPAASR